MAQTTVELRRLLDLPGFVLFDFDYQFDDAAFKADLEQRIIDYFYDMEIAFETPDMFKRKFKARFLRAIPYYNKLYNTTLLTYDPLINSKFKETMEQFNQSSAEQENSSSSTGKADSTSDTSGNVTTSDYPQQPIAGGDFLSGENESSTSTTSATTDSATQSGTSSGSTESSSNYTKTIEALTGTSYQELIAKERANILNIIDMVINEMKPCFMLVY